MGAHKFRKRVVVPTPAEANRAHFNDMLTSTIITANQIPNHVHSFFMTYPLKAYRSFLIRRLKHTRA